MHHKYTIGLLQLAFSADTDDNLKKTVSWVDESGPAGSTGHLFARALPFAVFLPEGRF